MTLNDTLNELKVQLESLEEENSKTTKVARKKARSIATNIKKLAADFKKISLTEDKA